MVSAPGTCGQAFGFSQGITDVVVTEEVVYVGDDVATEEVVHNEAELEGTVLDDVVV